MIEECDLIKEYDFLKTLYISDNYILVNQHKKFENNREINILIYQESEYDNSSSIMIQFIEDKEYFENKLNPNLIIRESYINEKKVKIFSKNVIGAENGILYAIFKRHNFSFYLTTNDLNKEAFLVVLKEILK